MKQDFQKNEMPRCSVKVLRDERSQAHPLKINVYLGDSPNIETSVGRVQTATTVVLLRMLPVAIANAHESELLR